MTITQVRDTSKIKKTLRFMTQQDHIVALFLGLLLGVCLGGLALTVANIAFELSPATTISLMVFATLGTAIVWYFGALLATYIKS